MISYYKNSRMLYLILFFLLFLLEIFYFKIADKFNIIDKPNERSSHSVITLRGGGVVFYFSILAFFFVSGFQYPYFFIGLSMISAISFLDDVFSLSNKLRIIIQLISMFLMFYEVQLLHDSLWVVFLALIFCVGIINAYNFMDGINGITVSNSIAVFILLAIVNYNIQFVNPDIIYFSIISCVVFGFFNFRKKAKAFAGDVGSVSMAFIILFLLAMLIHKTGNIIYILFLLVYGVDSVLSIARRIVRKENIFEAHRSHLYQFFVNENKSHPLLIAASYGILQLLFGLMIIYITRYSSTIQLVFSIGIMLLLGLIYIYIKNNLIEKYRIK